MKKLFVTTIAIAFVMQLCAQCTVDIAAKLHYSCVRNDKPQFEMHPIKQECKKLIKNN